MDIIVVGCEHLGAMVAIELANLNHNITVIESDEEKLVTLGSGFNGHVISGIEYDHDNLVQSGIEHCDALLALTNDDNLNITVSLVAKQIFKVKKVIAQVIEPNRRDQYDLLNIESISPIKMGVNSLLSKMDIVPLETVYKVTSGYEITHIHVQRDLPIRVSDIQQKCDVIVSAIIANGIGELVKLDSMIKNGDSVVCTHHIRDRQRLMSLLVQE